MVVPADAAIVETCPARAALAGNPSDGYGGAVLAILVPTLAATVAIRPDRHFELHLDNVGAGTERLVAERWDELHAHVRGAAAGSPHGLTLATIGAVAEIAGPLPPVHVHTTTTIPRSVGLAGSSAIVIACLRALLRATGAAAMAPDRLAVLALGVEVDRLGIAAGLQDRVVQAFGTPMMMRFRTGSTTTGSTTTGSGADAFVPIEIASSIRLVVAHRAEAGQPSQLVHRRLRERFERGEPAVVGAMAALRRHAESAADAVTSGDVVRLGAAMDGSFDVRRALLDLDPRHVEMIEVSRRAGGHANFTGSGGAVVVACADHDVQRRVTAALRSIGCTIVPGHPSTG